MPKRSRTSEASTPSCFVDGALETDAPARRFAQASPYSHVRLDTLIDESLLLQVRKELQLLQSTFKETDMFKVYQTGDLANVDPDDEQHKAVLPATIALRKALYSDAFREFVQKVTQCRPLVPRQDLSCNMYRKGGHLLCHDDVIGTRCVSYILYLARPGKQWQPKLGGALELYQISEKTGQVDPSPVCALPPEFGSMVMFTVQPGVSYHAVQEVASSTPRLSISGWFHAATPPPGAESAASLAQLQGGVAGPLNAGGMPQAKPVRPVKLRRALVVAHEEKLRLWLNPAYLQPANISAIKAQLKQQGAALLANFLRPEIAAAILAKVSSLDAKDGLVERVLPPHAAGTQRRGWRLVGPPQLRRYMRYRAPKDASGAPAPRLELGGDDGEAEDGMGAMTAIQQARLGAILDEVRRLMHSAAFVQLMSSMSGLKPSTCASEVRRFRPGLDYSLAHVGTQSTVHTLDATLAFVGKSAESRALWDSGDVGGFECHVPASKEELTAAEVYRADESTAGVTSIHASFNALSLVMRAPETMKFIKYVSCEAPGSRWDVAAEYASNGPTSAAAMPSPG